MKLMTKEILRKAKKTPLYSTEDAKFPKDVLVKYFFPAGRWTWYATEYDGDDTFFGYVVSGIDPAYDEWGYFSLSELKKQTGMFGLKVERDMFFENRQIDQNGNILKED